MSLKQMLALTAIRIDGGTQSRVELNNATVEEYSEAMADGVEFPPVVVFFDGASNWLADGFHRYFGADHAGIEYLVAEVRNGTQQDAQLFSFGVNAAHGLRRSNADKRKSVTGALQHPVSCKWSDNQIAKHCGVHHSTVGQVRGSLANSASEDRPQQRTYTTKHGTTAVMNTANIGKQSAPLVKPASAFPPAVPAAAPPEVVEPEIEAPPDYTELDALRDQVSELQNDLVVARMGDVPEEDKQQAAALLADKDAYIKTLEATNKALVLSRDALMEERAQMLRQMKAQRAEIERLKSTK